MIREAALPSEAAIEQAVDTLQDLHGLAPSLWAEAHHTNLQRCLGIVLPLLRAQVQTSSNGGGERRVADLVHGRLEDLAARTQHNETSANIARDRVDDLDRDLTDLLERVEALERALRE